MIREIKLLGKANDKVDYYVTISGADLSNRYYYESIPDGDRFFSGGNEFVITRTGVRYMGTGGHVCQYMFGVDLPLKDLLRKDVSNRLVMFGAYYDKADSITFSNTTGGEETYDRIFLTGNAVSNYFFFVDTAIKTDVKDIQRDLLRRLGKQVKRSEAVGIADDSRLCREIFEALEDPKAFVFLFRLVNLHTREYFDTFNKMYTEHKQLPSNDQEILNALADLHDIPPYQQERIKIDGMYKLAENKKVVDEYKDILIAVSETGEVNPSELAKLSRLRTLSLRLNIPGNLFDTLDELLLKDMKIIEVEEPEYMRETRAILEGFFLKTGELRGHVSPEDLTKLLKAKQRSMSHRDPAFESLLLDTVRACDEHARDTNDMSVMEGMSYVLTYFDRYDSTATTINNLAFMERSSLSEDSIRSLSGNMDVFDKVKQGFFQELFFAELRDNSYLTRYGRKKVEALYQGLEKIRSGDTTYRALSGELNSINNEERLYSTIHRYIKERFRSIYAELNSKEDQEIFIQDLNREIQSKGIIKIAVPHHIYEEIILDIRKESFYLNNLLPHIIVSRDSRVREDFLTNSGLDRFYVEELERDYFDMNQIDGEILEELRA
ncbi:MAG: TIGR04442 family protein [Nitrospirota bacterium]|nr:TIGR04442 family protein [Nitrospirota bacterium]